MGRWGRGLSILCIGAIGVTAPPAVAAEDSDVIAYRQHVMRALDAQTAVLGMILSGAIPDDQLLSHLDTIALGAASALSTFEAKVPGGESSPDVWTKWPDFSQRMNAFAASTASVAKLAREQGKDAIMSELASALSCKPCHDSYRLKK